MPPVLLAPPHDTVEWPTSDPTDPTGTAMATRQRVEVRAPQAGPATGGVRPPVGRRTGAAGRA